LPLWVYNLQSGGATLWLLLGGAHGDAADPAGVLAAWWDADLPRALGLWNPWGWQPPEVAAALAALFAAALAWAVLCRPPWARAPRPLDGPLLLLAVIPVVFTLSG